MASCLCCGKNLEDNLSRCMKCGKTQVYRNPNKKITADTASVKGGNPYQSPESIAPAIDEEQYVDLAGRWNRFLANVVDCIIMGGVTWIILLYVLGYQFKDMATAGFDVQIKMVAMGVVIFFLIQGPFLAKNSQTVGKKILGLKIVNVDGSKIDFLPLILKRYVPVWIITNVPIIGGLAGLVNVLFIFRSDRRCVHDLIAGTMVVKLK